MKLLSFSIILISLVFAGVIVLRALEISDVETEENVSVVNGEQVVVIDAKGGYSPRLSQAKANIPTTIKVNTKGTFDCSSSLVIPDIGYRANLPFSGETVIEIPAQRAGTTLRGFCAMGMYSFLVNFD